MENTLSINIYDDVKAKAVFGGIPNETCKHEKMFLVKGKIFCSSCNKQLKQIKRNI